MLGHAGSWAAFLRLVLISPSNQDYSSQIKPYAKQHTEFSRKQMALLKFELSLFQEWAALLNFLTMVMERGDRALLLAHQVEIFSQSVRSGSELKGPPSWVQRPASNFPPSSCKFSVSSSLSSSLSTPHWAFELEWMSSLGTAPNSFWFFSSRKSQRL